LSRNVRFDANALFELFFSHLAEAGYGR